MVRKKTFRSLPQQHIGVESIVRYLVELYDSFKERDFYPEGIYPCTETVNGEEHHVLRQDIGFYSITQPDKVSVAGTGIDECMVDLICLRIDKEKNPLLAVKRYFEPTGHYAEILAKPAKDLVAMLLFATMPSRWEIIPSRGEGTYFQDECLFIETPIKRFSYFHMYRNLAEQFAETLYMVLAVNRFRDRKKGPGF